MQVTMRVEADDSTATLLTKTTKQPERSFHHNKLSYGKVITFLHKHYKDLVIIQVVLLQT